jgi:hypothetical protein
LLDTLLDTFTQLQKAPISFATTTVRPSVQINVAPTSQMGMTFETHDFYENLSRYSKLGYNQAPITDTLHEDLSMFTLLSTAQGNKIINQGQDF